MEVRVRERLIGALVLVAVVVLLVPAVLTGPDQGQGEPNAAEVRSVEVTLDDARAPAADDDELVPEPAPANPAPPRPAEEPPVGAPEPELPAPVVEKPVAASVPPAASRPTTAAVNAPTAWAVQLGAFSTREKAEDLVANLRKRGYAAFVLEYRAKGQVLHRVRVGPEQDRARADAIASRLRKDGFQPVVAPHP